MFGSRNGKWQCLIVLLGFAVYLCAAGSIPITIDMSQSVDDALFIRLGRAIASGHWLGPYNQRTLVKGPIYPIFLALASSTGLPFNIVQYGFYFFCCRYFASVLAFVGRQTRWLAEGVFVVILLSPHLYMVDRVLREVFYTGLTILLFAMITDLLFIERTARRKLLLGIATGGIGAAYWVTREENLWIVPSIVILLAGAFYKIKAPTVRARAAQLFRPALAASIGAALVVLTIGGLNRSHYGRFVLVEMTDGAFQGAMTALQRVGSTFQQPYLPVPKEARELLYTQSPSFAKLRDYLEPDPGSPTYFCPQWQNTCGDISGGWFMWKLREAVDRAGIAHSAKAAARFYDGLAWEVESACRAGRLPCAGWLPPFVPPITSAQWQLLPETLGRAVLLAAYVPSPWFDRGTSYLETADSPDAVQFLNRPFATLDSPTFSKAGSLPPETAVHERIRSIWAAALGCVTVVDRLLLAAGLASFVLTIALAHRLIVGTTGIVVLAFVAALGTRIVMLSLVEVSSFPDVDFYHILPADPLALAAAILSMYMLYTIMPVGKAERAATMRH